MKTTVLLTNIGEWKFLPPFIIFKGEQQSKLYKNIKNYEEIKTKRKFTETQINAWYFFRITYKKWNNN